MTSTEFFLDCFNSVILSRRDDCLSKDLVLLPMVMVVVVVVVGGGG